MTLPLYFAVALVAWLVFSGLMYAAQPDESLDAGDWIPMALAFALMALVWPATLPAAVLKKVIDRSRRLRREREREDRAVEALIEQEVFREKNNLTRTTPTGAVYR